MNLSSSFLFSLYAEIRLPAIYGGEYEALAQLTLQICRAWISVGLMPTFVFDGKLCVSKAAS